MSPHGSRSRNKETWCWVHSGQTVFCNSLQVVPRSILSALRTTSHLRRARSQRPGVAQRAHCLTDRDTQKRRRGHTSTGFPTPGDRSHRNRTPQQGFSHFVLTLSPVALELAHQHMQLLLPRVSAAPPFIRRYHALSLASQMSATLRSHMKFLPFDELIKRLFTQSVS